MTRLNPEVRLDGAPVDPRSPEISGVCFPARAYCSAVVGVMKVPIAGDAPGRNRSKIGKHWQGEVMSCIVAVCDGSGRLLRVRATGR